MASEDATLPDDLDTAHHQIRELAETLRRQDHLIARLQHQLEELLRARYGRKGEKVDPDQLLLFAHEILAQPEPMSPAARPPEQAGSKADGHGRKPLPAGLPRKRIVHDVAPEDRACPECGAERRAIGEEAREQLEYVPASLVVLVHVRPKYACRACAAHVVIAPRLPEPIERGLPGTACWPTSSRASSPTICRSIARRRSSGGTASSWPARRCATGWPPAPGSWSRSSRR